MELKKRLQPKKNLNYSISSVFIINFYFSKIFYLLQVFLLVVVERWLENYLIFVRLLGWGCGLFQSEEF